MGKFKMEDYDPVETRVKRFYGEHADGGIRTSLLTTPDNMDYVVVRAEVWIGDSLRATGLAQEIRDKELSQGKFGEYESVNYTSWLENAETSAIGRALANFNYTGNKRASREEMQKVERMTADPVMEERQRKHAEEQEHRARAKAKDLIDSCRNILDDDVCMDFEVRLADAKGFDAVVAMGKEIRAALEDIDPDTPRTKKQVAETMKK